MESVQAYYLKNNKGINDGRIWRQFRVTSGVGKLHTLPSLNFYKKDMKVYNLIRV